MQEIILKFIGTGIGDKYQACVNIYDTCDNVLYKTKTHDGKIIISLKSNALYFLEAISVDDVIKTSFYVTKCQKEYTFAFKRSVLDDNGNLRTITFLLTEANYANLPIEKGEMFLWPK